MKKHTFTIDEAIESLQELGFRVNELKQNGQDVVPMESYTRLLDWSIDTVTSLRDQYMNAQGGNYGA